MKLKEGSSRNGLIRAVGRRSDRISVSFFSLGVCLLSTVRLIYQQTGIQNPERFLSSVISRLTGGTGLLHMVYAVEPF